MTFPGWPHHHHLPQTKMDGCFFGFHTLRQEDHPPPARITPLTVHTAHVNPAVGYTHLHTARALVQGSGVPALYSTFTRTQLHAANGEHHHHCLTLGPCCLAADHHFPLGHATLTAKLADTTEACHAGHSRTQQQCWLQRQKSLFPHGHLGFGQGLGLIGGIEIWS